MYIYLFNHNVFSFPGFTTKSMKCTKKCSKTRLRTGKLCSEKEENYAMKEKRSAALLNSTIKIMR